MKYVLLTLEKKLKKGLKMSTIRIETVLSRIVGNLSISYSIPSPMSIFRLSKQKMPKYIVDVGKHVTKM